MPVSGYTLLGRLCAGRDGTSYLVRWNDFEDPVELRRFDRDRIDASRWQRLVRRHKILATFTHPVISRVLALGLEQDPPEVIVARREHSRLIDSKPDDPLEIALAVTGSLVAAHGMGLAHGALDPWSIRGSDATISIDFCGTETTTPIELSVENQALRYSFRAPEATPDEEPSPAADIFSLGKLLEWLELGSRDDRKTLTDPSPDNRPTAIEIYRRLERLRSLSQSLDATGAWDSNATAFSGETGFHPKIEGPRTEAETSTFNDSPPLPEHLGRFRLLERLGSGGMGDVYRAMDIADGSIVAIKTLKRELVKNPTSLERFRKEARMLARVRNPFVTRLIEINEQDGVHFLVLEYVEGESLDRLLESGKRLDVQTALAVAADVARGLSDAHRLGIVHRDVKPANILVVGSLNGSNDGEGPRVKLSDFGLARQTIERESMALTQSGMIVGTPTYMSPEQCSGGAIDTRTDVYALGATLFHLVAGRPPFEAETWHMLMSQHLNDAPPSLRAFHRDAGEGLCRVVEKALAKSPDARYADASAILDDFERLLRGEPTALPLHPALPEAEPGRVLAFDFEWPLESPPQALWPLVSNTDRLDRAIGFAPVSYRISVDSKHGLRRFFETNKAGQVEAGEEQPYEWVEGRRFGVARDYERGPFKWVVNVVELAPRGTGTTLRHRLRLEPRGRLIRVASKWGVGRGLKNDLERVYRRIDAVAARKAGFGAAVDPFEAAEELDAVRKARFHERLRALEGQGVSPEVVERIGEYLATAPSLELARIRPIALARRLGLAESDVIEACLRAANVGLLVLLWDLLCPICRVPSEIKESLKSLTDHGRCEACQTDYVLDFANSVELIFRSHPEIREADTNTYCAAGPAHSPHVVAQVRLQPGERLELDLSLSAGTYKIRGPQLGWSLNLSVRPDAVARRWDVDLKSGPIAGEDAMLAPGSQVLLISNPTEMPIVVRVERAANRDDALTAARASSLALFRALFPNEILAPGQLVSIASVTLLLTGLETKEPSMYESLGDPRAFAALHEQFRKIDEIVRRENGAVVKSVAEGILATFTDTDAAFRAALDIPASLKESEITRKLNPRMIIHRGPAMAVTLNDHLDYFGTTVFEASKALESAEAGTLILTAPVAGDLSVAARIARLGLSGRLVEHHRSFGPLLAIEYGRPTAD